MHKARIVRQALRSKGFREYDKRDHRFYFLIHNGKKSSIFTKVSHSHSDVSDSLCSLMAKQMRLTGRQFNDFVACAISEKAYVTLLIESGQLVLSAPS